MQARNEPSDTVAVFSTVLCKDSGHGTTTFFLADRQYTRSICCIQAVDHSSKERWLNIRQAVIGRPTVSVANTFQFFSKIRPVERDIQNCFWICFCERVGHRQILFCAFIVRVFSHSLPCSPFP